MQIKFDTATKITPYNLTTSTSSLEFRSLTSRLLTPFLFTGTVTSLTNDFMVRLSFSTSTLHDFAFTYAKLPVEMENGIFIYEQS